MNSSLTADFGDSHDNPIRRILADVNLRAGVAIGAADKSPAEPGSKRESLFDETNWGLIKAAQAGDTSKARSALAELCETYWYPLYAFIRRKGYATDQAQDLTQGFFLVLLEHEFLKTIGREKGKFRSFLLASCRNYLVNEGDERPRPVGCRARPLARTTTELSRLIRRAGRSYFFL
jgi:hypothetical protein